jgi:hypothetical protein
MTGRRKYLWKKVGNKKYHRTGTGLTKVVKATSNERSKSNFDILRFMRESEVKDGR